MSDREKLIELLCYKNCSADDLNGSCDGCKYELSFDCFYERMADRLIANGVTVQKWIPVSERLPKKFVTVLVQMPLEEPCPTVTWGFLKNDGGWYANYFNREDGEVTHWMPMPQAPKGE